MPRNKRKNPTKIPQNDDMSEFTPSRKRRKRDSSFEGWRRKVFPPQTSSLPTLTVSLQWNAPEDNIIPTSLRVVDGLDENLCVTADDIPVSITENMSQALRKLPLNIQFIFNSSTKTELNLSLAIKTLPLLKAQSLIELVFSKVYSEFDENDISWNEFFKELELLQRSRNLPKVNMQIEELKPILRDYQAAAVDWMLERERCPGFLDLSWLPEVSDVFQTSNGHSLLFNKYSNTLYTEFNSLPLSSGGILADEMGLGKTVVTLALLLHNKRIDFDENWEMIPSTVSDSSEVVPIAGASSNKLSERQLNQENSLNADEQLQLVPCRPGRGLLKSKLEAWYESQLSRFRMQPPKPKNNLKKQFKCTCGDVRGEKKKKIVTCNSCKLIQHEDCCGYKSSYFYLCPSCWRNQKEVPSRATLIIVPPAILTQWVKEIEQHAPSLRTFKYGGIKEKFVQPLAMANNDVVLTTYSILSAETLYTIDAGERSLRNEGRFLRSSSPLERVNWWRIVCDEAQLVESDLSLVRQMTNLLKAVHRWCVTGTPIQRGVADLYYLTSFMGLGDLDDKNTWTDFLLKPYKSNCKTPLLVVLSQVFWRSTKEVVEASLPAQRFQHHNLKFTAIEENFYMQQHALSAKKFADGLGKSGVDTSLPLDSIDKHTLNRILQPLLNVRQACTHAQVVTGVSMGSITGASNLADLTQYLYKRAKQQCEEALRVHVSALNGLAGLHWFSDVAEALKCYRTVFRLAEELRGVVQVDVLQRIHALTNASLILEEHSSVVPPTLRDDHLQTDAEELEKKYLSKTGEQFSNCLTLNENISKEIEAIREDFESDPSAWWHPVLLALSNFEEELIDKLAEALNSNDLTEKVTTKSFLNKIRTLRNVEITIKKWWDSLEECYKRGKLAMESLLATPRNILKEEVLKCHLRVSEGKVQCSLCSVEKILLDLECELFAISRKVTKKREKNIDGAETKGSWKAHKVEKTLSTVFSFARSKVNLEGWCVRDGKQHAKLLEAMKKEFKLLRTLWTALNHCVHAEDELTMAKQRIVLQDYCYFPEYNPLSKSKFYLRVHPSRVPEMMYILAEERDSALSDFNKKKGRMTYLYNLSLDRNAAIDPCPICKCVLEKQWCVLYCGHCLCFPCLHGLIDSRSNRIKCPICREITEILDIGFVDVTEVPDDDDINVIGDYSTKVDNIIREVLRLVMQDKHVKILIFSTWKEVLKILGQALQANSVSYVALPSNKHQEILKKFLDKLEGVTVLLLPLAWGSKGLNLTEATHVFLAEPILNPAEELQAIGRVHRIGQTRPTVVHRFIVKRTVEEKIFAAVSEAKDTWTNKKVTLADLQRLFVIPAAPS